MRDIPAPDHEIEYSGGALALDFTNTLGGSMDRPTHEHLRGYDDLLAFQRGAGAITTAQARELQGAAEAHPREAARILAQSVALRAAVWRVFAALAAGKSPPAADLARLRKLAAEAYAHSELADGGHGFAWRPDATDVRSALWPIALSAVDLLRDPATLAQVRQCASATCSWLFVDRSRNHSRLWCDMSDCGNRDKVRRFRERAKRATRRARS
jgi:predicted RNA-binding Zn ribbon-like protein